MKTEPLSVSNVVRFPEVIANTGYTVSGVEHYRPQSAGGDGGGNDMEARIARLESDVHHIQTNIGEIKTEMHEVSKSVNQLREHRHSDKLQLILWGVAAAAVILGTFWTGYLRLSSQNNAALGKISQVQVSLQHVADAVTRPAK